ncbi:MAG: hypothetical protein C4522_17915 [Desulfobacteraceae bacterium]|nr:MAG: hypothetical protein C4522_17915 [Desulfobacteraceae bacterium]
MHLSRSPTPFEWALALYFVAVLMIGFGIAGLVVAHRAAPDKEAAALALEYRAFWFLGLGVGVALITWISRKLTT